MKSLIKKLLICIGAMVAVAVITVGVLFIMGSRYMSDDFEEDIPEHVDVEDNAFDTIVAVGEGLYEQDGDLFEIKGINYGNLFISEGWMTINSLGAAYNDDGSFERVNNQGIVEEYEEIYQEEMDAALLNRVQNGDFTQEQLQTLYDTFFYSYCTEADFELLKDTGINTIRLPVYYRTFMEGSDDALVMREDAFEKLDYFLDLAKKYDLKVIIDMHGVVGGQSGYEHSGTRDAEFWDNETYINSMCELWRNIALHYINDRPDLASTILAYDLVNEPIISTALSMGSKQWKGLDKLYDAIREVDDHHVISIESVWYPVSLPSPGKFDWENVLYQYHFYNWNPDSLLTNELFYRVILSLYSLSDYDVPKFVGEFNFFGNEEAWDEYLELYDSLGWGWTVWSYKVVSVGWWDSSWGLAVRKLNLQNDVENTAIEDYRLKLDIRTASYEEILQEWSKEKTQYGTQTGEYKLYRDGTLYKVFKDYFGDDFKVDHKNTVD
ncbi:MAG: glycoside hydrolase family 5 protein [Clostridiales bacterium]|nr:glycoside hydrolase family 5 protein [Clostridiales bacterium]